MPLRTLHVASSLDPRFGGVAAAIAGLAPALQSAGIHVHVVSTYLPGSDNSVAEKLRDAGVRVNLVGPARLPLLRHRDLAPLISRALAGADIVHIHALWEEAQHLAALTARRANKPYIITPHGMLDPWSLRQSKWKKRLYLLWRLRRHLDAAAAIHYTTPIERDLAAPLRLKPSAIVEPNGLDFAEFENLPPRGALRAKHNIPPDRPLILFLSRIHHKKGLDLLVPAFARANLPGAILVIAGPDNDGYQSEVQKLAAGHRVADRLRFTGMLKGRDRIEAFVDADLFTLPSYQENFGIVVAEALACGTPVVISDQVNIHPEISAAGVGGVAPLDIDPLAAELHRWTTDPVVRQRATQNARPFVRDRYDWQNIAKRWRNHYQSLGRPGPITPPMS
jgi:glycosyltransferase involved in cell wall biosynthesis